jgi:hemolysin activation/secretion protein
LRIPCLLALLWCAPVGAASLADLASRAPVNPIMYPMSLLRSVSGYLASQLEFSGNSSQTSDAANGQLHMVGSNLIMSSHDLALDFHDSVSRRSGSESQSLRVRYAFPVAGGDFSLALEESDYAGEVSSGDQRFDAQGEYRALSFSGSRALWSGRGLELDSVFSHSSGTSSAYQDSEWVSDSGHQSSRVGLRCSGQRELPGGFMAGSTLTAMGGWESWESENANDSSSGGSRYHKLAFAASLNRSFYTWDFGVDGRYQFAPDDLASSEYLQVAGPSMMRGFNGQSKYVSEGGWFRVNARSPGYAVPFTNAFNSYLAFSVLKGWSAESDAGDDSFRASTGEISLRLQGQDFNASVSVGRILDLSGQAMQRPASPDVSLTMAMRI